MQGSFGLAMANGSPIMYNVAAVVDYNRFASYYDLDFGDFVDDLDLYLNFAERCGSPVLEIGCGTGRVLLPLARAGFRVTGIDISPAMLDIAERKLGAADLAGHARLVRSDARSFQLPEQFAMAFIALNSFMHFSALDEQLSVLSCIAGHLTPGGLLILDLFNPDLTQLREARGLLVHDYTRPHPSTGHAVSKFHSSRVDIADQRLDVTFIYDEQDDSGVVTRLVAPFAMHYFWPRELSLLLDRAGFEIERTYGSYDLEPYTADSERLVAVATRREREQ